MSDLLRTLKNVSPGEVGVALALAVVGLGEIVLRDLEPRTPLLILALLTPLPLVWRIRFPLQVLGVSVGILINGQLVAQRDDFPVSFGCVALVATYSAAPLAWTPRRYRGLPRHRSDRRLGRGRRVEELARVAHDD